MKALNRFKALTFMMVLIAAAGVSAQVPNTDWYTNPPAGIDGSLENPYEIYNADELAGLARLVNGTGVTAVNFLDMHIKLMDDIDLANYGKGVSGWNSGRGWVPIGHTTAAIFRGVFDGNDKKITNLFINGTINNTTSLGLFGHIGSGGSVRNLGLEEVEITGTGSFTGASGSSFGIGSLAGRVDGGTITGCYSVGTVDGRLTFSTNQSGGAPGHHFNGFFGIGGIVGNLTGGTITNCYSVGRVDGSATYSSATFSSFIMYDQSYTLNFGVGGVAGRVFNSSITNSYSAKTVNGSSVNSVGSTGTYKSASLDAGVGGVAGHVAGNTSTVANSYSIGAVSGRTDGNNRGTGGIVGYRSGGSIINCAALNPSIASELGTGTNYNRVLGRGSIDNTNNIAFSEMDALGGVTFELDNRLGVDITTAQILADAAMGGRFTEENGWTIENGKLPGLFGQTVEMPKHLLEWLGITRHIVSFNRNGGTVGTVPNSFRVPDGSTINKTFMPSTVPFTRANLANDGKWYTIVITDGDTTYTEFIFGEDGTPVTKPVTLYLQWFPAYTVSFNRNGGTIGTVPSPFLVVQDGTVNAELRPSTTPFTRTGFVNDGRWYTRTGTTTADFQYAEFIFGEGGTKVTGTTTLYLQWLTAYTVSFDLSGGTAGTVPADLIIAQDSTINERLKPLTTPFTRTGYLNDGKWYTRTGTTVFTFTEFVFGDGGTPVTGNTTLYLRWNVDTEWCDPNIAGAGTAANPFRITTPKQLAYIALMINDGNPVFSDIRHYRLENDIDLSIYNADAAFNGGKGWVPIGVNENRPFRGIFDGGGNVISGLYINDRTLDFAGLFGRVRTVSPATTASLIRMLGLEDVNITARNDVGAAAGSIQGYGAGALDFNSYIISSYVTGTVTGSTRVGGIIGIINSWGGVINCYTTAEVSSYATGTPAVGGIAGSSNDGEIVNCAALNPRVAGAASGTNTGRIVSNTTDWSSRVNNIAFNEMLNGSNTTVWNNKGLTALDGADISAAQISADGTLGGRFTGENGWVTAPGKLPDFRGTTAAVPVITHQPPVSSNVGQGSIFDLSVTVAAVPDNGTLSYQWFSNTAAGSSGGTIITGATGNTYRVPTSISGTYHYYVVVSNTIADNGSGFPSTSNVTSNAASVRVFISVDDTYFAGGYGWDSDPFQIATAAQLAKLAELVNAGDTRYNDRVYILTGDINLSAYGATWNNGNGWIPIGSGFSWATDHRGFRGVFDGNNKKITGLYRNATGGFAGLFGSVIGGTVKNISIENGVVTASQTSGIVAGYVSGGRLINCYATGSVETSLSNAGGLVGELIENSSLENCYFVGSVTGSVNASSGGYTGGIAGRVANSIVTNSYSMGSVTGGSDVGGLVGWLSAGGSVVNSYSASSITGTSRIGGLVGYASAHIINSAALNPYVRGTNAANVGRVVGTNDGITSGNAAFAGMGTDGGRAFSGNANRDGESITAAAINTDGTIGSRFTAQNGWTTEDGKLPGLFGAAVAMPAHLVIDPTIVNAIRPTITDLSENDEAAVNAWHSLSVTAASSDNGTLSYQWFSNTTAVNMGGTVIPGERGSSYIVPTFIVGTYYYYVIVTNTIEDNGDGGQKSSSVTSAVITIKVEPAMVVLSPDRNIPKPDQPVTEISPLIITAGEFTAGPNPAARSSGKIKFYRMGSRISDSNLRIYDASGNMVKKIKITDNAANSAKRHVGAWDLKDSKGRTVGEGTYVVKGVIIVNGKKEKVSLILGIR